VRCYWQQVFMKVLFSLVLAKIKNRILRLWSF
jgi:hypothetical protein